MHIQSCAHSMARTMPVVESHAPEGCSCQDVKRQAVCALRKHGLIQRNVTLRTFALLMLSGSFYSCCLQDLASYSHNDRWLETARDASLCRCMHERCQGSAGPDCDVDVWARSTECRFAGRQHSGQLSKLACLAVCNRTSSLTCTAEPKTPCRAQVQVRCALSAADACQSVRVVCHKMKDACLQHAGEADALVIRGGAEVQRPGHVCCTAVVLPACSSTCCQHRCHGTVSKPAGHRRRLCAQS